MTGSKSILRSALLMALLTITHPLHAGEIEDRNTANTVAFYEMVFNQHNVDGAITKFMGDEYIQHNPFAPDGIEGFRSAITGWLKADPSIHADIVRTIAQDDLVTLHVRSTSAQGESAVIDIFRLDADGKIVEHWDVSQPVPDQQAHDNTMF
ncbi:nuclear transport factor 2 family protein [Thalassospira sp. CH_XMU1448-2]|uniref:nuclear transport factor 2 family protein n=1 Tax=Thalassospira sp. CH_XMU1448-2 TaxID=3107773 RepID=UPI00300A3D9A